MARQGMHEGLANLETYLVSRWLRHSDKAMEYWLSIAGQAATNARHEDDVVEGLIDAGGAQLRDVEQNLVDHVRRHLGDGLPELGLALLESALRRVDWPQLARFVVGGLQLPPRKTPRA